MLAARRRVFYLVAALALGACGDDKGAADATRAPDATDATTSDTSDATTADATDATTPDVTTPDVIDATDATTSDVTDVTTPDATTPDATDATTPDVADATDATDSDASAGCGAVTFEGCCTAAGKVRYCDDGQLAELTCGDVVQGWTCAWLDPETGYDCAARPDASGDPELPYLCPGETCPADACGDRECGYGCGGVACGDHDGGCAQGSTCRADGHCHAPVGCGDLPAEGCCAGSVTYWCANDHVAATDCTDEGCGWVPDAGAQGADSYFCGGTGNDPTGTLPSDCAVYSFTRPPVPSASCQDIEACVYDPDTGCVTGDGFAFTICELDCIATGSRTGASEFTDFDECTKDCGDDDDCRVSECSAAQAACLFDSAGTTSCSATRTCLAACDAGDQSCHAACYAAATTAAQAAIITLDNCLDVACPDGEPACIATTSSGACATYVQACH